MKLDDLGLDRWLRRLGRRLYQQFEVVELAETGFEPGADIRHETLVVDNEEPI